MKIVKNPKKLIKENSGDFIFGNYDNYISYSNFPNSEKCIRNTKSYKGAKTSKYNYRPVSNQMFLKYIKD